MVVYPYQQPPPRPRSNAGAGCLIAMLVAVGIVTLLIVFAMHKTPEQRAEEARRMAEFEDAAAQQRVANDHARADFESKVRKGCKMKADAAVFVPEDDDAMRERCRDLVRLQGVKVPGSEHFSDDHNELFSEDGCNRSYASYVIAKNAFGVDVKTSFVCTLDPRTGIYSWKVSP